MSEPEDPDGQDPDGQEPDGAEPADPGAPHETPEPEAPEPASPEPASPGSEPSERPRWRSIAELVGTVLVLALMAGGIVLVVRHEQGAPSRPTPPKPSSGALPQNVPRTPPPSVIEPGDGTSSSPGSTPGGPAGGLKTVKVDYPVRVTTANIYQKLPWSKAVSDLSTLTVPGTDMVGLNEITPTRASEIASWVGSRPGWSFWAPPATPSRFRVENSVLWNSRNLSLLDSGSEYASRSATPTYAVDSRWVNWVKFEHKPSKTNIYFLVTHTDPAVERGGHPRNVPAVGTNLTYMRKLLEMSQTFAKDGVVVICGDWNVNAKADRSVQASTMPYAVLEGGGSGPLLSNYSALGFGIPPTSPESGRWIDYVAIWNQFPVGSPTLDFAKQYSATRVNSDHDPVTVDFRYEVISLLGLDELQQLQQKLGGGKGR